MANANKRKLSEDRLLHFFEALSIDIANFESSSDYKEFAVERLRTRCKKRAQISNPGTSEKALNLFREMNQRVVKHVDLRSDDINNARLLIRKILESFTSYLDPDDVQGVLYRDYIFDNWRFGPGSSNEVTGTHCAEKMYVPMTSTQSAESLVFELRMRHPYFNLYDRIDNGGVTRVSGSKLTTVPKNQDVDRTIAVEPSGNMCLQLAAGMYLEESLRRFGLDIRTQEARNKLLAQKAYSDGLCTIDLKSASDLVSPALVRLLLPPVWYELLMRIRSPLATLPDGEVLELNMMSTMGNGFTFPLMTLIILSLLYAVRSRDPRNPTLYIDFNTLGVYGDDIIVKSTEFQDVVDILHGAGFIVNTDKSYATGPFYESCGGDYYKGEDVTPFYVTELKQPSDIYSSINKVLSWCAKTDVFVYRALRYLFDLVGNRGPYLVPEWCDDASGIRTLLCPRKYKMLQVKTYSRRLKDDRYLMSLACGGYVFSRGGSTYFAPKDDNPRYRTVCRRIPTGYATGEDPLSRSSVVSQKISLMVSILS